MSLKQWLFGKFCKRCKKHRTKKKVCSYCKERLADLRAEAREKKALEKVIRKEGLRCCPRHKKTKMKKIKLDNVYLDTCPKCKGIWLDKGELRRLQKMAEEGGYSSGYSSGESGFNSASFVTGMMMASSMAHTSTYSSCSSFSSSSSGCSPSVGGSTCSF